MQKAAKPIVAGGASSDITPRNATFLYGYPHTPRLSTGVHDPLFASSLFLNSSAASVLFAQVDLIWLPKNLVEIARAQISSRTGINPAHIMVAASHTHSGPVTSVMISNADDPIVPPPDPEYLECVIAAIVHSATQAVANAEPAEVSITSAVCTTLGSNRLDPAGPRMSEVPVLAARAAGDHDRWLGLMFVNPVHPTVLHADSTLVSGDFPAMCREFLQARLLRTTCPVLCHLGAAGNQSPRHVVRDHSTAEAKRLGEALAAKIISALTSASFSQELELSSDSTAIDLPLREMPSIQQAAIELRAAQEKLRELKQANAPAPAVRTAECAVYGAEETLSLARAADEGKLTLAAQGCLPAEIQVIRVGEWSFVGWPGEVFVEFALGLRRQRPDAIVITLANGELQGYLVTAEGVNAQCYEAGNAIFASPQSGDALVAVTKELLSTRSRSRSSPKTQRAAQS